DIDPPGDVGRVRGVVDHVLRQCRRIGERRRAVDERVEFFMTGEARIPQLASFVSDGHAPSLPRSNDGKIPTRCVHTTTHLNRPRIKGYGGRNFTGCELPYSGKGLFLADDTERVAPPAVLWRVAPAGSSAKLAVARGGGRTAGGRAA